MAFIAIIGVSFPFFESMKPGANAGSTLPHIHIGNLKNGSFITYKDPIKSYWEASYIILKNHDSKIHVYIVPLRNNQVMLPDVRWWRWGSLCNNFGPDMEGNIIKKNGTIQCQDKNLPESWSTEWKWSYNGKNLGSYTDDLEKPKYKVEGQYVIVGRT